MLYHILRSKKVLQFFRIAYYFIQASGGSRAKLSFFSHKPVIRQIHILSSQYEYPLSKQIYYLCIYICHFKSIFLVVENFSFKGLSNYTWHSGRRVKRVSLIWTFFPFFPFLKVWFRTIKSERSSFKNNILS